MGKILGHFITPHPPIIIPEIGMGEEDKVINTVNSMKKIAKDIRELQPDTIVIITPHGPMFRDAIAISDIENIKGTFGIFEQPDVKLENNIDVSLTKRIINYTLEEDISIASITNNSEKEYGIVCELDHGSMVPLYYINREYKDYRIVHITYGILSKDELYKFGMIIKQAILDEDKSAVIIASGDLSHRLSNSGPYEYSPNGSKFDKQLLTLLESGDTLGVFTMDKDLIEEAGECGLRSFYILLGIMDTDEIKGELLSYEGTFGVGYGVLKFITKDGEKESYLEKIIEINKEDIIRKLRSEDIYVKLARESLNYYLENEEYMPIPENIPEDLLNIKRGVFVSFKKEGELRGCIGTILPTTNNVVFEIIKNSVEAGTKDPRFFPIDNDELDYLEVSVDEIMEPEPATFDSLDPKRYGVIVRSGMRTGLLLPDLEGVDTSAEQVDISLQKAGISKSDKYTLERFEVIRHR
ncbi:extradiol ring-cleavage dioxygenase, class III protein, subunit B [Gottschalkia acidurici 9a]|uniref:Extradiol ring-cleavage dioxygenase, class III protein, subunit B n=1 Tax=Gottschalkia acidurici (strain ATCC 7906 / DSM 604 / BCRC 14475 / CIP 104303 / KCTC 5404 / NCIMB 10678 / 9a) TaxID=1128398 RepID=K0AZB2_GOTA9|nr:AmmeMemoRadiSam system protein A [Gottschalkia acidurici]AFS78040.1 extradiol ring-cleavage dioxygenase, class III protein, subunit B [Gottschalkia acidurici 9a]